MAHIHLIVHVMHELVPKSALIVLMGRHVNKNTPDNMQTLERVTSGGIFIMPVKYIPEKHITCKWQIPLFQP
jgi:hypothetical protein